MSATSVGAVVVLVEVGAVGRDSAGGVLVVRTDTTDVKVETSVVTVGVEVVDDDVDDVSEGGVDSNRLVVEVVWGINVVELVVDNGCELLVGGNEVCQTVVGGELLVVVGMVVGHVVTVLVVVSTFKDVVVGRTVS